MKLRLKHFFCILFSINLFCTFAQNSAVLSIDKALDQDTVEESISVLEKEIAAAGTNCDKRVLLAFTGSIQEQASLYQDASKSFAQAAGLSVDQASVNSFVLKKEAKPAEKIVYSMLKKTSGILVLDAVRCSLNAGDSKTAASYLNSSIRNSKDEKIIAKIKLYEIWAQLCETEDEAKLDEIIVMLKAYSAMPSMKTELPSVLFTLWYISADKDAAIELKKNYPFSPEASVVSGASSMMPTPFWFFVARKGNALESSNDAKASSVAVEKKPEAASDSADDKKIEVAKKYQVGLFGKKENASSLVERLNEKGFKAFIEEEVRPSGNKYYLVLVNENDKGNMGMLLKTAGFDCYPVF